MPEAKTVAKWSGSITALTGLITGAVMFGEQIKSSLDFIPTKSLVETRIQQVETRHIQDMEQVGKYARGAYSNTLPPRILHLLKMRCRNPHDFTATGSDLPNLLARLIDEYEEINERTYTEGTCEQGVYCTRLGVCSDVRSD